MSIYVCQRVFVSLLLPELQVDINNIEYPYLLSAMKSSSPIQIKKRAIANAPTKRSSPLLYPVDRPWTAPPAPLHPLESPREFDFLIKWDRIRGHLQHKSVTSNQGVVDLFMCWSQDALYFAIAGFDLGESAFYADSKLPLEDAATWLVSLPQYSVNSIKIVAGNGLPPSSSDPAVTVVMAESTGMRSYAAIRVPGQWKAGMSVNLDLLWTSFARAYTSHWMGSVLLVTE